MTDAGLLAEATVWAATNPECANQAFNINNGDLFRWQEMWPKIAAFFDMDVAPPLPMSLDVAMADKEYSFHCAEGCPPVRVLMLGGYVVPCHSVAPIAHRC